MIKTALLTLSIFFVCLLSLQGQGIDKPRYQIETHRAGSYLGTFKIELFPLIAPKAVKNFDSLVNMQFFDSTAFHRVVPGFVIQGGDPNSINGPMNTWGNGQLWQVNIPAEFSVVRHVRGIIGAARDIDTNSANSQFYICVANALSLDGQYTVFGRVTENMQVVDTIVNSPRDANDYPLQKIEMFVTSIGVNDTVPDIPTLLSPANNATGILGGNAFQWSNVDGAALYNIQIATDSNFTNIVFSKNSGLSSTAASSLISSTTYYWRVKSNNGGHESIYSNYFVFNTAISAQLIYPGNNSLAKPINPLMQWTSVPNVNSYRLQIATASNFIASSLVVNQAGITATSRLVNLSPNTQYYWRITYISGGIQGFYSQTFTFTTGTSVGIEETENNIDGFTIYSIYPNPAHHLLTAALNVTIDIKTDISIRNMIGEEIYKTTQQLGVKSKTIEIN